MGAYFTNASSTRLVSSPAIVTAAPFTIGLWVRPNNVALNGTVWSLGDTASANNSWLLAQSTSVSFNFSATAGGVPATATSTLTIANNVWYFIVAREIAAANRRLVVLPLSGPPVPAVNTTSRLPAGIDLSSLGSSELLTPGSFFDGTIAEYWITDTDIQPDGLQLSDQTLRQLARSGPFSIPHIGSRVLEYRSLRNGLASNEDSAPDYFYGSKGRQSWVNTNGVIRGSHPPLNEGIYRRPGDFIRLGIV